MKGQGHELLDKPGGEVIKKLGAGKIVTKVKDAGDYILVDVPRQIVVNKVKVADFIRGYCRSNALVAIGVDPS